MIRAFCITILAVLLCGQGAFTGENNPAHPPAPEVAVDIITISNQDIEQALRTREEYNARWVKEIKEERPTELSDDEKQKLARAYCILTAHPKHAAAHSCCLTIQEYGDHSCLPYLLLALKHEVDRAAKEGIFSCNIGHIGSALKKLTGEPKEKSYEQWLVFLKEKGWYKEVRFEQKDLDVKLKPKLNWNPNPEVYDTIIEKELEPGPK